MNCAKCGEVCSCPMTPSNEPIAVLASEAETAARLTAHNRINADQASPDPAEPSQVNAVEVDSGEPDPGAWRGELAARLSRYRARRKAPPPRYPSLKLPFEKLDVVGRTTSVASYGVPSFEANSNRALALDGMRREPVGTVPVEERLEPAPVRLHAPVPHASAKIIEFPRFAWGPPPPPPDQLAEPVGDQLRILEVPETLLPSPALGGITIEPVPVEVAEKRLGIDIPVQTAPLGRRIMASFIDGLIIASASALFGVIFWRVAAVRPPAIQFISLAAGILAVFWAVYQYLLIVYSASTPGLRAAGLELSRFDGSSTTRSVRRWRIFASYLSALSLGMGYGWVFLDEDSLCWHDRITHTYLGLKEAATENPRR